MIRRRRFLYELGGGIVALPLMENFVRRSVFAAPSANPVYSVFFRQANGVVQPWRDEPQDKFWPQALGAITRTSLRAQSDRTLSELADYADKLLLVRGTKFNFAGNMCGHSGGGNQCLTAAKVSVTPSGNKSLAMGESVDNRIARELTPGVEPLTLMAGDKAPYIGEVLSYKGPKLLRAAERSPFNAYMRLMGLSGVDREVANQIAARRMSVNDLLRSQVDALKSSRSLSSVDRSFLDVFRESIRDTELRMACNLADAEVATMQSINNAVHDNDKREEVTRMHMNVIALGFACGLVRTATLQIGSGNDSTRYLVDGERMPSFHQISHRIFSDGSAGDPIPQALEKHHKIDRLMARLFKYLLDRLSMYPTERGTLLDDSFALWTNDLANGPPHAYSNIPQVIAGSAGGFLKTGQYIDAGNVPQGAYVTHNRFLNTLLNAAGIRKSDGSFVDDFGDPSLTKGIVSAMIA